MRRAALLGICLLGVFLLEAGLLPTFGWAQDDPIEARSDADTLEIPERADVQSASGHWWIDIYGYVRAALELVQDDPNFDFVGENNGFVLHNARLGFAGGHAGSRFSWLLSVDAATDLRENLNVPAGELQVRLRDAYFREDASPYIGIQIGQFRAPFSAEELRSTADLLFVSRAVGFEGVRVGRGFEQPGIVVDRQLGLEVSPLEPVYFGPFGVSYAFMLANGNGDNQILNDNNEFGLYGRIEFYWEELVRLGGSVLSNRRTEGELPNRFDEDDFGWSVDLLVEWEGLEVFGQYTTLTTEFPTNGNPDQEQVAWHAQVGYLFDFDLLLPLGPTYRIAFFDPRAEEGSDANQFRLLYHTIGLNVGTRGEPVRTIINYTFTTEEAPRELENNRFEALVQLAF